MTTTSQLDLIWCDHHLQRQILMIFLFFGSSIAHLEPELQQFEDRLIFAGISATGARFGFPYIPLKGVSFLFICGRPGNHRLKYKRTTSQKLPGKIESQFLLLNSNSSQPSQFILGE